MICDNLNRNAGSLKAPSNISFIWKLSQLKKLYWANSYLYLKIK